MFKGSIDDQLDRFMFAIWLDKRFKPFSDK